MAGASESVATDQVAYPQDDPWAAAFAAINQEGQTDGEESSDTNEASGDNTNVPEGTNSGTDTTGATSDSLGGAEGTDGGQDNLDGAESQTPESDNSGLQGGGEGGEDWEEIDVQSFRSNLQASAENQAINDVARDFIKRGARHRNGALGARPDDPDIMKRDEDGVPHWYNPDTGQEFMGENPRRQAKEWCEDYNNELAQIFNSECQKQIDKIMGESESQLAVLEFAPKYNSLDPIRQAMFDSIVEDYEIKDASGNAIGYSIDLDKALAAVNRQVQMIQQQVRSQQSAQPESNPQTNSSGPALDMKSNASKTNDTNAQPKSLAEAMEMLQKQELEKNKR